MLTIEESVEMLRDVAMVLDGMSDLGLQHNDVKPANILRSDNGWTLIDPCLPDVYTTGYYDPDLKIEQRDVLALGVCFNEAVLGLRNSTLLSQFFRIPSRWPKLQHLSRRMLGDGRCVVPDAATVVRKVEGIMRTSSFGS